MTLAKISLYYILNTDSDVFCNDVSRAVFGSFHCAGFVLLFESMQIHTLSSNLCRFLDWIYCWKELPRDIDFIDDILVHIFFSEKSLLRRLISSNSNEAYDNLRKYNINDIPNKLILLTFSTQQNEFIRIILILIISANSIYPSTYLISCEVDVCSALMTDLGQVILSFIQTLQSEITLTFVIGLDVFLAGFCGTRCRCNCSSRKNFNKRIINIVVLEEKINLIFLF